MKSMIQIGAGNIGRACIGRLFHNIGYKVYFSDVNKDLLSLLHEHKSYPVRLVGKDCDKTLTIDNIDILPSIDTERQQLFNDISIITTAVGVNILDKIAPLIAEIISYRFSVNNREFLNIIACENAIRASSSLKKHVETLLNNDVIEWMKGCVAFPDAATDSIVPLISSENPLLVTCENFAEVIIDKNSFLGLLTETEELYLKDDLDAYIERKLFTLNTGHAITAYLGFYHKYKTIKEAIANPEILHIVKSAMEESGAVLIKRYQFNPQTHADYILKIISRFENPFLDDEVERVGRDPMRKLSQNDRLVKPSLGAIEYNLPYTFLLQGIKFALLFNCQDDPSSIEMNMILKNHTSLDALLKITHLDNSNKSSQILLESICNTI